VETNQEPLSMSYQSPQDAHQTVEISTVSELWFMETSTSEWAKSHLQLIGDVQLIEHSTNGRVRLLNYPFSAEQGWYRHEWRVVTYKLDPRHQK
jgi:hypothetical protein